MELFLSVFHEPFETLSFSMTWFPVRFLSGLNAVRDMEQCLGQEVCKKCSGNAECGRYSSL